MSKEKDTEFISFRITPELFKKLKKLAKEEDRTVSHQIRHIIKNAVREK